MPDLIIWNYYLLPFIIFKNYSDTTYELKHSCAWAAVCLYICEDVLVYKEF